MSSLVAKTPLQALEAAISSAKSQAGLGTILGVSQRAVSRWVNVTRKLPAEHVLKVEEATGVSRHDLRPDLYPRELTPADAALDHAARPDTLDAIGAAR